MLIGKAGSEIEVIKKDLSKLAKGKAIIINVKKVDKIDQDAQLVAEAVASLTLVFASLRNDKAFSGIQYLAFVYPAQARR